MKRASECIKMALPTGEVRTGIELSISRQMVPLVAMVSHMAHGCDVDVLILTVDDRLAFFTCIFQLHSSDLNKVHKIKQICDDIIHV